MPTTNKHKVSVCFVSAVESVTNTTQIKAAYKDICKQIASFAEAIATDPNIIISHSVISEDPKDMKPVSRTVVDAKFAELQTINKRIEQGKSQVVNPNYKSKYEATVDEEDIDIEEDEEETPHITSEPWVPPTSSNTATKVANDELKGKMEVAIFSKIRKTEKSSAIINYLLSNPNTEVSIGNIATGTKLGNLEINSWLAQTGKKIKAIRAGEKRGHYLLDTSRVKV